MEWLTEYFDLLVPVALVLMFLFQRVFTREEGEERQQPRSEADEAVRRIQEEIRRKIIARQQGRTAPPQAPVEDFQYSDEPSEPPELYPRQEAPPTLRQEWERPIVVESPPPPPPREAPASIYQEAGSAADDLQEALRRQKARLEEARRAKAIALEQSRAKGLAGEKRHSRKGTVRRREENLRGSLLADLSQRESLQRAFVLKEVLDRPVGLREER